ncbi:MAG TPA: Na/Pi symporter [Longimicrobiales bacterium]|nr:Na/Pi symporter [Longimicrobiales bacterium]
MALLVLLFLFLVGVNALGSGFELMGEDLLSSFFAATDNPFIGLMIGILATTLVQSSSVTTASIVGFVAAPLNPLPVANAIPMIMGANIGTTVTNTVASLAHINRKEEFRRAFAVATCHDFFNYLAVLILLPLELATGFLQKSATALTGALGDLSGADYDSPIKGAISAATRPLEVMAESLGPTNQWAALILVLIAGTLIFVSLMSIVSLMRSAMKTRVEALVTLALGKTPLIAIAVGIVATVMVQSSSITTSLLVPLAGAGVLTLQQAFPVTLGANIGTTVTALLAALAATGEHAAAGLTIALVHLLFNLSGTLLIYPWEPLRDVPLRLARWLADLAVRSRVLAVAYVVILFYLVPAAFAVLNRVLG